ncbi:hypothetical protein PFISCL1PPCAC_23676, partial [Pristionchus fissidentatus]
LRCVHVETSSLLSSSSYHCSRWNLEDILTIIELAIPIGSIECPPIFSLREPLWLGSLPSLFPSRSLCLFDVLFAITRGIIETVLHLDHIWSHSGVSGRQACLECGRYLVQMESHVGEVVLHLVSIGKFVGGPEYSRPEEEGASISLNEDTLEEASLPMGIIFLEYSRRASGDVQRPITVDSTDGSLTVIDVSIHMEIRRPLTPSTVGIEVESSLVTSRRTTNDRVATLIHIRLAQHHVPDSARGRLPVVRLVVQSGEYEFDDTIRIGDESIHPERNLGRYGSRQVESRSFNAHHRDGRMIRDLLGHEATAVLLIFESLQKERVEGLCESISIGRQARDGIRRDELHSLSWRLFRHRLDDEIDTYHIRLCQSLQHRHGLVHVHRHFEAGENLAQIRFDDLPQTVAFARRHLAGHLQPLSLSDYCRASDIRDGDEGLGEFGH